MAQNARRPMLAAAIAGLLVAGSGIVFIATRHHGTPEATVRLKSSSPTVEPVSTDPDAEAKLTNDLVAHPFWKVKTTERKIEYITDMMVHRNADGYIYADREGGLMVKSNIVRSVPGLAKDFIVLDARLSRGKSRAEAKASLKSSLDSYLAKLADKRN
jgi:hypothetical protein